MKKKTIENNQPNKNKKNIKFEDFENYSLLAEYKSIYYFFRNSSGLKFLCEFGGFELLECDKF